MIQDEHIQTLMKLGLTLLQAKTYLNLIQLGKADVKTIAKVSNIARQDIYRIMPPLQKLGLTEKIITKPTMYEATPIKEGLSILLQSRKKETAELQTKTSSLVNDFQAKNAKVAFKEEDSQFIIISEITRFLKIHRSQSQKAQESLDIVVPLVKIPSKAKNAWPNLKKPLERGVKIRLIAQEPRDEKKSPPWQVLARNPLFEFKYLATPLIFGMHITDRKEVTLQISAKNLLPSLWTKNPTIVELAVNYFNEMWSKSQRQDA